VQRARAEVEAVEDDVDRDHDGEDQEPDGSRWPPTASRAPETCDFEITRRTASLHGQVGGGYPYTQSRWTDRRGALMHELLEVEGLGHACSGGLPGSSFTDPRGPDATDAICRFFAEATTKTPPG
jgi:hypothetical protein